MPITTIKTATGDSRLTDAAIIAASRRDPTRFAEIFDRHWPRIHRYCVSRAGVAGEDVAAETFRVALDSLRRFDRTREDARPWLYGIATNLLRRNLRSESRRTRALLRLHRGEEADLADGVLNRVEAEALGPEVAAALGRLPAAQREALLLSAWGELTYEQVAEATGVPVATVRSRMHRARASIRRALQHEEALR
ncbi:MAG: RNA polymerase sigma factor [Solirubrobacteraceae bacterium]